MASKTNKILSNKHASIKKIRKVILEESIDFTVEYFKVQTLDEYYKNGEEQYYEYVTGEEKKCEYVQENVQEYTSVKEQTNEHKSSTLESSTFVESTLESISEHTCSYKNTQTKTSTKKLTTSHISLLNHPYISNFTLISVPLSFINDYPLTYSVNLFYSILHKENILQHFKITKTKFLNFINTTFYFYNENIYHNIFHAFNILFTGYYLYKKKSENRNEDGKKRYDKYKYDINVEDNKSERSDDNVNAIDLPSEDGRSIIDNDNFHTRSTVCDDLANLLSLLLALYMHDIGHLGFTSKTVSKIFETENSSSIDFSDPTSLNERIHFFIAEKILLNEHTSLTKDRKIIEMIRELIMSTDLNEHKKYEEMIVEKHANKYANKCDIDECSNRYDVNKDNVYNRVEAHYNNPVLIDFIVIMKMSDLNSTATNVEISKRIGMYVLMEMEIENEFYRKYYVRMGGGNAGNEHTITENVHRININRLGLYKNSTMLVNEYFNAKYSIIENQINFYVNFSLPFFEKVAFYYKNYEFVYVNCKRNYSEFNKIK